MANESRPELPEVVLDFLSEIGQSITTPHGRMVWDYSVNTHVNEGTIEEFQAKLLQSTADFLTKHSDGSPRPLTAAKREEIQRLTQEALDEVPLKRLFIVHLRELPTYFRCDNGDVDRSQPWTSDSLEDIAEFKVTTEVCVDITAIENTLMDYTVDGFDAPEISAHCHDRKPFLQFDATLVVDDHDADEDVSLCLRIYLQGLRNDPIGQVVLGHNDPFEPVDAVLAANGLTLLETELYEGSDEDELPEEPGRRNVPPPSNN